MTTRRLLHRLYYFTVEDEGLLAEAFPKLDQEGYCVAYKVADTDDVFVTTAETKEALERIDFNLTILGEEDPSRIGLLLTAGSREELAEYEDALRALVLASRAIGAACVGVSPDTDLGFEYSRPEDYTYFTVPGGHTYILRLFFDRRDAVKFLKAFRGGDPRAVEWASTLPLASSKELKSFQ
jgi:hypothetical protein